MRIAEQLSHFRGLKGGNGRWTAYCPCCEPEKTEGNRHLALSEGDNGKLLLYCFHGCRFEEVLKAAGLSGGNGFAPGHGNRLESRKRKPPAKLAPLRYIVTHPRAVCGVSARPE